MTQSGHYDNYVPSGTVVDYAGSVAPLGWVLLDGSTLDGVTNPKYSTLFDVIGTTYGGTGRSSFVIPDCRGRVSIGAGTGSGLTARSIGDTPGAETLPAHTHVQQVSTDTNSTVTPGIPAITDEQVYVPSNNTNLTASTSTQSTGTGSHGVIQPSLVLNKILKL